MCTNIYYQSKENNWYFGRTQEYADDTPVCGVCVNSGVDIQMSYTEIKSSYKMGGVNFDSSSLGFKTVMILDGLNEYHLTGATLAFPDYLCKYDTKEQIEKSGRLALAAEEVVTWVLANYSSINDIKNNLNKDVSVCKEGNRLGMKLFQHYMFADNHGNCIVVEPTHQGEFEIHDNPVGVMTNQPEFSWHLKNLQNYLHISDQALENKRLRNLEIPAATGSSLVGLPGDSTPQSRFIRASILLNLSEKPEDACAVLAGFHVLNNFDIPKGVVHNSKGQIQYTQYTSMYDLKLQKVYVKFYDSLDTKSFDLNFEGVSGINYIKL